MNNHGLMRDHDPEEHGTLLERYDRSRVMFTRLMDRSLEMRFQQYINRQCADDIHEYEACVAHKWPWQLKQCQHTLDAITKCRLSYNTKAEREEFLERERQMLKEMDEKGETLFDHDLIPQNPKSRQAKVA